MSRLAYGIPTQTGAQAFRREVEQSLASWRDMIDKDDARVVRSIHIPPAPNSIDGPMPVTIYQIAVRATGRISHLSIQGKHNPLPTPISNWYEGQKANARTKSRSRSDSEGKLAAKRRLQAAREAEAEAAQDAAVYGYDDSGFEASGEFEHEEQTDGCKESFLAHKKARFVAGEAAQEAADEIHHHDTSMVTAYDQVPIHVHPPTPRKPSKPSARRPGPPRYSQRTRSASMNPGFAYTPDELRHTIASTLASTAQSDAGDTWSQLGSDVTATSRALRRSSRLASLAPGGLDHNDDGHSMTDATRRLHDVGLVEGDDGEADDDLPDTDMSSMIIDYEDPEEAAMARQQESAEAARRQAELTGQLPCIPDFALPGERTIKLEPDYDGGYEFGPHGQLDTMAAA